MKKALIFGITGQDGSYLAELLIENGYEVHGIKRRSSSFNTNRIDHIRNKIKLHYGDITDSLSVDNIIYLIKPDEIYNLAAQSHVKISFDIPEYTAQVDAVGTLKILESIRKHVPNCKFYNACTSEMFGKVVEIPQTELTPFYPRSPYGVSKIYSYWITKNYREAYNIFACNGILFNHESPRRGENFVTKKIVDGIHKWINTNEPIYLGNLDAKRDWGYAKDYVEGMWKMMQYSICDDYVLATGETHTIREFIEEALNVIGYNIIWKGKDLNEIGYCNNIPLIKIDKEYFRPTEVDLLIGDYTKAKNILGWEPTVKFKELVKLMMTS